jgi:poly(ADP-ribose) glycohydrolase
MEHCEAEEIRLPCHYSNIWHHHLTLLDQIRACKSLEKLEPLLAESQRLTWCIESNVERDSLKLAVQTITRKSEELSEQVFINELLPWIVEKTKGMKDAFPDPVPVLRSGIANRLHLTKPQEVCLMSAFFLCHLPLRHWHYNRGDCCQLKLISIIVYLFKQFKRERRNPTEFQDMYGLDVHRRVLRERKTRDDWLHLNQPLCPLTVEQTLLIEDHPDPCWRIDFANEWIGGGVLSGGNVQEELYFAIHPELQLTMLFCQVMLSNEAIVVKGAERVTNYSGYGHTAHFEGVYEGTLAADQHIVVAIDAGVFLGRRYVQYEEHAILRELNKAYVGFFKDPEDTGPAHTRSEDTGPAHTRSEDTRPAYTRPEETGPAYTRPVVTGNWGCGAFGGNHQFKACLQWMAATAAGRNLVYCCFKDKRMVDFERIVNLMSGVTVAQLYRFLLLRDVQDQLLRGGSLFEMLEKAAKKT